MAQVEFCSTVRNWYFLLESSKELESFVMEFVNAFRGPEYHEAMIPKQRMIVSGLAYDQEHGVRGKAVVSERITKIIEVPTIGGEDSISPDEVCNTCKLDELREKSFVAIDASGKGYILYAFGMNQMMAGYIDDLIRYEINHTPLPQQP